MRFTSLIGPNYSLSSGPGMELNSCYAFQSELLVQQTSAMGWRGLSRTGGVSMSAPSCVVMKLPRTYVPYPNYNLLGRLLVPRDNALKRVENNTGCRVFIRGRGAFRDVDKQGTTVSCATRSTPFNADNMEEIPDNDADGSASKSSCLMKRPLLTKLMFGLSGCEEPWLVPWTSFTIFQVMFLWFCTFWLVGSWIIPFAAHYAGCSKDTLTYRGQALYSLITDIAEGTVGLGILHRCLARFKPLPRNWFPFSWRGQWYIDVLLGCLTFPVVNRLSQLNLELLPFPSPFTSSYEQSIMTRDPIASVLYAIVVSVCCPIWEEVIFRGFLLPSLTRYLPMWASIFVSALVFGLVHFNVQRMLPLTFLGLIMGIMFVRSRNLLSSMLLHSLWNGFVFMGLLR